MKPDKRQKERLAVSDDGQVISEYWRESSLPLTSLLFVIPILLVYEVGIVAMGPSAMRNGAEIWLRQLLDWSGLGQYLLLPSLTCCLLLGWHYTTRQPWKLSRGTLPRMYGETALVAIGILGLAKIHATFFQFAHLSAPAATPCSIDHSNWANMVGYFGAGIYEEVLFRLALIPLITSLLRALGESRTGSLCGAAIAASLIFSAAHYQTFSQLGESFRWDTFLFRFCAGLIFSALFIYRGFGITAGAHTAYDLAIAWMR